MPINTSTGFQIYDNSGLAFKAPSPNTNNYVSGDTDSLRVRSDGYVRRPYIVAGNACSSSNGSLQNTGNRACLDTTVFDNVSAFHLASNGTSANDGYFLAPISGVYHFEWHSIAQGQGPQFYMRVNGGQRAGNGGDYAAYGLHQYSWCTTSMACNNYMAAGDSCDVIPASMNSSGYWHGGYHAGLTWWQIS